MPPTLGLITARGGSTGLPGKNIKPLIDKPLLAWTIEAALSSRTLSRVILSTDDDDIASIGQQYGAEVPFQRPAELATADASHVAVAEHALDWHAQQTGRDPESLMLLQPTSPLRTAADIDAAIELAHMRQADAVVGVCHITQHPYLSKYVDADGYLQTFVSTNIGYLRRQAFPELCHPNGALYWIRTEVFRAAQNFFPPRTLPYLMPEERSLDIDTAFDFYLAELILRDQLVKT